MNKNVLSLMACRNGWTIKTRSGMYIVSSIEQLRREIVDYAILLKKEADEELAQKKEKK